MSHYYSFTFNHRNDSAEMGYPCYHPVSHHWEFKIERCAEDKWYESNKTCHACKVYYESLHQLECNCTKDGVAHLEDMPAMFEVWFWLYEVALPTIGGVGIVCNTVAVLILLSR